jgi:hypothetical protein
VTVAGGDVTGIVDDRCFFALETGGGGGGGTLDDAYDFGGLGAGRTINATDGSVLITNADADPGVPNLELARAAAYVTEPFLGIRATGDAQFRFTIDGNGRMQWGSGAGAADIVLSRAAANRLAFAAGDTLSVQYIANTAGTRRITTAAASPHVHIDDTMRVDQALGIMSNPVTTYAEFLTIRPSLPFALTPFIVSVIKLQPTLTTNQALGIYYAVEGIMTISVAGAGQTIYQRGLSYVVYANNNTANANTWAELECIYAVYYANAGAAATHNITLAAAVYVAAPVLSGTVANINITVGYGMRVDNIGNARTTNSYAIYIANQTAGATASYGIYIQDADTYAVWVDAGLSRFDGDGTDVFELPADATANGAAQVGRIPCSIGGVTRYLYYYGS